MDKKLMLEDMILFPEDQSSPVEMSIFDLDDEPQLINDQPVNRFTGMDDDAFEFGGVVLDDNVKEDNLEVPSDETLKRGILSIIMDLITDEQEAIKGYNDFLSTLSFEDQIDSEKIKAATKVVEDIVKEENTHIGQLMQVQALFNPDNNAIKDGADEGREQIIDIIPDVNLEENVVATPPKSLFEEIQKATFVDPKIKPNTDTNSNETSAEEVCTLTDTDDEF